jgi:hypothetical protein
MYAIFLSIINLVIGTLLDYFQIHDYNESQSYQYTFFALSLTSILPTLTLIFFYFHPLPKPEYDNDNDNDNNFSFDDSGSSIICCQNNDYQLLNKHCPIIENDLTQDFTHTNCIPQEILNH